MFTIATFNVHEWEDAASEDNLERVIQITQKYKPDIICLQEMKGKGGKQLKTFAEALNYGNIHKSHGVAILSKFPMKSIPTPQTASRARFAVSEITVTLKKSWSGSILTQFWS